jgi:[acyl-carrier-protein] S-malonyltransferase
MPVGKDPQTGEKPSDKAKKFSHDNVAEMLRKAEQATPPGRYQPDGIGNNRKLYGDQQPAPVPKGASWNSAEPEPQQQQQQQQQTKSEATKGDTAQKPTLPVALLFPGQGSQYVKMLDGVKDLPEVKNMLDKAKGILGYDLLDVCLKGPEDKLAETRYCQPALFVGGLAGIVKLRKDKADAADRPQAVAGLSLGEYTALCAAGVLSFEDGLRLVQLRGEAMQEAAQIGKQAMVSVVGLERGVLDGLCKDAAKKAGGDAVCKVANVLFPKGFSCAGTAEAVNTLKDLAEKKGALQAKLLKTGGAFHTSMMQPAQEKLRKALDEVAPNMKPPKCAVYMNVTGEPLPAGSDPKQIVDLLNRQLVNPVLWHNIVDKMIKDGVSEYYECGPQKQIKAMMKRIDNKIWNKTTSLEV